MLFSDDYRAEIGWRLYAKMDPQFIENMKQKLMEMKTELIRNLILESEEVKELQNSHKNPKDTVEQATDDLDMEILERLGNHDKKKLELIDSALSRIKNGKYGRCLNSGKLIAKERLEAIPYALYCIEVQEKMDKFKRRN